MIEKNKYKELSKEEILVKILETESLIHSVQDVDVLLEQILTEARSVVNADAGSIYIAEGDRLAIRYAQNDTLQKKLPAGKKLPYIFFDFPISNSTIAGCAANTKKLVNVPDVYNIDPSLPFKFGKATDEKTGYKTVSNLTIPILSMSGMLLGVLQVLNALDKDGKPDTFSHDDEIYLSHFASNAGIALEHAFLTRSMVLRMIKMAELRDPKETGMHVNRVANYSVEIYDRWAFNNGIPMSEQTRYRDSLKIASMLHDVGKVAISDTILKKAGKLTDEEFATMKTHTWLGARLFNADESNLDKLSMEIALRHHENWDGTGYPGNIDLQTGKALKIDKNTGYAQGLCGEEIPLGARIVAMADVYDALSSKRSYKDSWTEEDILAEVKNMSGKKFDPQIVEAFFEVLERIQAIKAHFVDE
ncbi:HD domain-containing protein [Treponema sp. OMZ 792]|uniref:HD domain-containing phosphohydrolase n=1 Tax=unclassified Treponema TaxID=2638727 RepID=UPI0020A3DA8A|nr:MULTISPECIES: HD domain-containing phosphohydrolase [unclassified Treponema]UTC74589.1 HD domain-containing protein [Treponema sp. OMZ 792]UTC77134.1 HD domain-containing protein [Treponema sp. OMZ 799]UTC80986.1 HD domain-containing protein [Treponema sp. OMZ 798]